ncbi:MAG: DNA replication protein DnaC [Acidobacteria bacterium]|nr:MAG: DNA replication protein DnaC [Acidobacteriota bacterium]
MESLSATCARCGGTGWILEAREGRKQAHPCSCRTQTIAKERLEAARIPERYRDDNFTNFNDQTPELARAKEIAREFAESYPAVESGLLLVGPAGLGKTHLACAILSELVLTKGVSALYADFSDLLLRIQTSFRPDADVSKESVLTPYAEAELLVLDELGASKPHPWVLDVLYNLLNTRYNRKRITIATSNFEDDAAAASGEREKLEDRIGYRLRSRLYEMCTLVALRGKDYRKEILGTHVRSRF